MKKQLFIISLTLLSTMGIAGNPNKGKQNETVKINATESSVKWHAKKVTGEHNGTINIADGEVVINNNQLTGGSINIDMNSIVNLDLPADYKVKLEGHLKSDDFFSSAKFKTANLKVKSVSAIANAKAGSDNYNVTADLTIKGITNEITFPAMVVVAKDQVIVNANLDIDRSKYDVRYGSTSFFEGLGDKAIDNVFNVKVRVVGKR